MLVYADFRVKQSRDESGQEIAHLYSLQEAFDVILSKLDNVNSAKRRRYRYVYEKLRDFEEYMASFGVDTTLASPGGTPCPRQDVALMTPPTRWSPPSRTAVDTISV